MKYLLNRMNHKTVPSRELDFDIARSLGYEIIDGFYKVDELTWELIPNYTSNWNCAKTLIPKGLIIRSYQSSKLVPHTVEISESPDKGGYIGESDISMEMALCLAALEAYEQNKNRVSKRIHPTAGEKFLTYNILDNFESYSGQEHAMVSKGIMSTIDFVTEELDNNFGKVIDRELIDKISEGEFLRKLSI